MAEEFHSVPSWAVADDWSYRLLDQAPLAPKCREHVDRLREAGVANQPPQGYPPGHVGPVLEVPGEVLTCLLRAALARGERDHGWFVWQDLDNELAVHHQECRVAALEGIVLIGLRTTCDQLSGAELVVPIAVGTPGEPAGMVGVAEATARGPALLVDTWGETAVAAAWQALVAVCRYVAALAGEDQECRPLLPGAVCAVPGTLIVVPQAAHAIDHGVCA